jgi:ABC-type glycerol-3-phosphate transport system permease component
MHIATILSVVGAVVAGTAFARRKQRVMSLAFFFSLCYTVFDKVFSTVLPEYLVTACMALALNFGWQNSSRKRII